MTTKIAFTAPISKTARGLAFAEVYLPLIPDSQLDFMTAEAIEKMAHDFNTSGRADAVDEEHNGRKTGSLIVESFIAQPGSEFTPGAWVVGIRPDPLTKSKIDRGEIVGVSFQGTASETIPTVLNGKNVRELRSVRATAVSLTAKPANKPQGAKMVVKNDSVAEMLDAFTKLAERIDALAVETNAIAERAEGRTGSSAIAKSAAIAKADAEREIEAHKIRKHLGVLQQKLENLFERPQHDAARRERWLLDEIAKCEIALEAITPEPGIFDRPENSAFHYRGGTSHRIDATGVESDSAMIRRDLRKAADELDLNALAIGLRHRRR
jgi:hypothetical protein